MAAVGSTGIFASGAFTYTWATVAGGGDSALTLPLIQYPREARVEVGLWSLFIYGTGTPTLTPTLQFCVNAANSVYSPVIHSVQGFTNGGANKVTSFTPANGFEANLSAWQDWWLYSDGFRIRIARSADSAVTFTYGVIKCL